MISGPSYAPHKRELKRSVHFSSSINWSDENDKSVSGPKTRRERREKKRQRKMNDENRFNAVLDLFTSQDQRVQNRLVALHEAGDAAFVANANIFVGHIQGQQTFRQSLVAFQTQYQGQQFGQLSSEQQQHIRMLSQIDVFTEEFSQEIPAEVITDSSSDDSSNIRGRNTKRKKKWDQTMENSGKKTNRDNGGAPPPPGGPDVVPQGQNQGQNFD